MFNGAERLSKFDRGSPQEHFCEIILKSVKPFWRRGRLMFFFSSIFLALVAILVRLRNYLNIFGTGSPKEHSCDIISKSVKRFWRRNRLKQKLTTHRRRTKAGHNSSPCALRAKVS